VQAVPIGDLFLCLQGMFDARAAQRVREALTLVGPGGVLHLDLRQALLPDFALALLAQSVAPGQRAIRVVLQGLGRHQLRILRYFGVEAAVEDVSPASQA
jgi:hypothetical protein